MSGGLVPSKSTVYVSNLPFALRNNDIHKLFEKYGRIVKVSVLKERETRRSKGVAFILFLNREDALTCVQKTNEQNMFGRTLKASIAKDNGRAVEFIRRKEYPDKSRCYECGETGHLSYKCTRNLLGERKSPPKKIRKRKKKTKSDTKLTDEQIEFFASSESEEDQETLSAAIAKEHEKHEIEEYRYKVATGNYSDREEVSNDEPPRKIIKKNTYFSDEEDSD